MGQVPGCWHRAWIAPNSRVLSPCSSTTLAAAPTFSFKEVDRLSSLESLNWSSLH